MRKGNPSKTTGGFTPFVELHPSEMPPPRCMCSYVEPGNPQASQNRRRGKSDIRSSTLHGRWCAESDIHEYPSCQKVA